MPKRNWTAKWIWIDGDAQPRNMHVVVRKTFRLADPAVKAELAISADSRYRLMINGQWIGDGPARSFPHRQQFDLYDIAPYLHIGDNTVAISAVHYGEGTFHYILGRAAVLCQIDIENRRGEKLIISSDRTWKILPLSAYSTAVPRISCQMPFEEQYDARLFPPDAWLPGFDDRQWPDAVEIGPVGTAPWIELCPRTIPFLSRTPQYPIAVLGIQKVKPAGLVETVNIKSTLRPGDRTSNMQDYRGLICTEIISPKAQKARLPRQFSIYLGPWTLNGREIPHPFKHGTEIELQAGSNLFIANLIGKHHFNEFTLAIDAPLPVELRAPCKGPGKWLLLGPLDPDPQSAREVATELLDPSRWQAYPELWNFTTAGAEEMTADIWNLCYSQTALPGAPAVQQPTALLADNAGWTTVPAGDDHVELLLDFGQELIGYTEFVVSAPAGVIFDFFFFEAINDGVRQETYSNRSSFRYISRDGTQRFTSEWRRGFRYAALTIRNRPAAVQIGAIRTLFATYPAEFRGSFQCSDDRLNRIWQVGRHTLLCCMEDTFTDCPTYEQTYWVGDARNEALVCYAAFGEWALAQRCAQLPAESLYRSPLPESQVPSSWQNILTAWSLLWIFMIEEYGWYSDDLQTVRDLYPAVKQTLLACRERCDNPWGLLQIEAWNMFDWAGMDSEHAINAHNNLFLAEAFRRAGRMAKSLGIADEQQWHDWRAELIDNINRHLWSNKAGCYVDSIHADGAPSTTISQQTNTLALLYSAVPQEHVEALQQLVSKPPDFMVRFGSPFAVFFLLEELAHQDRQADILWWIRDRWGFMLDAGATTFWETFPGFEKDVPTRSHCHAWSAAPTYFLSRYQLGVSPAEPGFKAVHIAPQPVDLTWARGDVPTPAGTIHVEWKLDDWEFVLKFACPCRMRVTAVLPVAPSQTAELRIDGLNPERDKIAGVTSCRRMDKEWQLELEREKTEIRLTLKQ